MTDTSDHYDVTIALLTRDAGTLLGRVLDAIQNQTTKRKVELLAIDSGSTDGTLERLAAHGARVISIAPENFNFGSTRDQAYEESHGDFVVNLSQDAVPAQPDWLENLLVPFDDETVAVSCGASAPDPDRDLPHFPWERNGYFYFTREIKQFVKRYGKGVSFSNSAVRRSVWEEYRFDAQPLGEDFQFQMKLHGSQYRIAFPAEAKVLHHHHYDLKALYHRCRNEGMALRIMGCRYTILDLIADLISPRKYLQWLRELRRGSLKNSAAIVFPVARPLAVYMGSRFGKTYTDYRHGR